MVHLLAYFITLLLKSFSCSKHYLSMEPLFFVFKLFPLKIIIHFNRFYPLSINFYAVILSPRFAPLSYLEWNLLIFQVEETKENEVLIFDTATSTWSQRVVLKV